MTDDTTTADDAQPENTGTINDPIEHVEENEAPGLDLESYEQAIASYHNQLDQIKESARQMGADLEALLVDAETPEEKREVQQLVHKSIVAYQRVNEGDKTLLRSL